MLRRAAQWKTKFGCPSPVSREKRKADLLLLRKIDIMRYIKRRVLFSASRPDVTFITRAGKTAAWGKAVAVRDTPQKRDLLE